MEPKQAQTNKILNILPGVRLTVKTGGPSARFCCLLSFEVWIHSTVLRACPERS